MFNVKKLSISLFNKYLTFVLFVLFAFPVYSEQPVSLLQELDIWIVLRANQLVRCTECKLDLTQQILCLAKIQYVRFNAQRGVAYRTLTHCMLCTVHHLTCSPIPLILHICVPSVWASLILTHKVYFHIAESTFYLVYACFYFLWAREVPSIQNETLWLSSACQCGCQCFYIKICCWKGYKKTTSKKFQSGWVTFVGKGIMTSATSRWLEVFCHALRNP